MRAVRFHGPADLRVDEVDEPAPAANQVKIKNAFSGICGSDLHLYFGEDGTPPPPHPVTGATWPQTLGHEFSGTVTEIGADVTGVAVGDRVAVWPVYYCGECAACRQGRYNACRVVGFHGLNSHGGGMAEFTVVDAAKIHKLPGNVDLKLGALVEPMAVAWHAVERSGIEAGGSALIAGAGPIGIGLWFALKANGVQRVLVSEPSETRRERIAALGAATIDPVNSDLAAAVEDLNPGGVDSVFDAAGAGAAVTSGLANLTPGGRLVVVAVHERTMEFQPTVLVMTELEVVGALAYLPADFDAVIEAMGRGIYDPTGWVDEIGFDGVTGAFDALRGGQGAKFLVSSEL